MASSSSPRKVRSTSSRFRDALVEQNFAGFAIVEQDMYPTEFDRPLPIAKSTYAYLSQLGLS